MQIRGVLLDVEGVLVSDKRYLAIEGAIGFVAALRTAGRPLRLLSNNTTDDRAEMLEKLCRAGFDFRLDELHTCTYAAVEELRARGLRRLLVLGTVALRRMLAAAGFETADDPHVDAVVVGLDPELTFARLQLAVQALLRPEVVFIALHHNRIYGDDSGRPAPSVGSISAALEYATQRAPLVLGKPSPTAYTRPLEELHLLPRDVLMVSDDPLSDLAGARRLGLRTAFVLSGKYAQPEVVEGLSAEERPDLIVPKLGDLLTREAITLAR